MIDSPASTPLDLQRIESAFTSRCHRFLFHTPETTPASVISALTQNLPHIDPLSWEQRLAWGGTFVNGIEVNQEQSLPVPCKLEYYEPKFRIEDADTVFPAFSTSFIIYEDSHLLAVFKPAKLSTLPGKEQKHYNLRSYLDQYVGAPVHMPSRLDMSTAGLVIVSKRMESHNRLQSLFVRRTIQKTYLLEVSDEVKWSSNENRRSLDKDPRHPVLRRTVESGGKVAHTQFRRIASHESETGPRTLLEAKPVTGRTHQIRVHSADLGLPIVGDDFYGGAPESGLRLLSFSLSFRHPLTSEPLKLRVPSHLLPAWALAITADDNSQL